VPGGHQKHLDKSQTEFFAGSRNSMEATEDDERRKHGQSKSDFRKPRFDTFPWQELRPIEPYLGDLKELPIQCLG